MSLINKVAEIIDNKPNLDSVGYLANRVNYDDELAALDISIKDIVPLPPINSSAITERELNQISRMTKSRTYPEINLIHTVDKEPLDLFRNFLKTKNLPFPQYKFDSHYNIIEQYMYALKYYYNRARPDQIAPYYNLEIDVLFTDTHHTPSYPSGHTMYSELAAHVLADQYPEHKNKFFELSNYCGLARILQGVHYPSDNDASKIAIDKLYKLTKGLEDERTKKNPIDITGKA
tara:strand:- start:88551 stop:89249 length:699 start_codon:yes stop_codon:yes gene_type:complete